MKNLITTDLNGNAVYEIVNNDHMTAHKNVKPEHIETVIKLTSIDSNFGFYSVVFPMDIGKTDVVPITSEDDDFWACRPGRTIKSHFVHDRNAVDTNVCTVGVCRDDDGLMTVFTAYYGEVAPKEPTDPRLTDTERQESEEFWNAHAFAVD